jgi:HPr kinase/phosphorylase
VAILRLRDLFPTTAPGRLLARPVPELFGLLELRHIGIRPLPYEAVAVVSLVVDLVEGAARMPESTERTTEITGILLPCLALPTQTEALPLVLAELSALATKSRDAAAD